MLWHFIHCSCNHDSIEVLGLYQSKFLQGFHQIQKIQTQIPFISNSFKIKVCLAKWNLIWNSSKIFWPKLWWLGSRSSSVRAIQRRRLRSWTRFMSNSGTFSDNSRRSKVLSTIFGSCIERLIFNKNIGTFVDHLCDCKLNVLVIFVSIS